MQGQLSLTNNQRRIVTDLGWKLMISFRRMHLKLAFLSNDIQIWECDLPVLEVLLEEDLGFIWLLVIIICLVCIRWSEHYNQIRILSIHSSHLFFFPVVGFIFLHFSTFMFLYCFQESFEIRIMTDNFDTILWWFQKI